MLPWQEYSFLQLDNGLKAIIGSDPKCDKAGTPSCGPQGLQLRRVGIREAGAGLCVNVGMCHERPGKGRGGRGVEKLRDLEDHEPIKLEGLEVDVSGFQKCWLGSARFEGFPIYKRIKQLSTFYVLAEVILKGIALCKIARSGFKGSIKSISMGGSQDMSYSQN